MRRLAPALLLTAAAVACAPAPQPYLHDVGQVLPRAGHHIAAVADLVDRVPVPVPVRGSKSCSRPGCR